MNYKIIISIIAIVLIVGAYFAYRYKQGDDKAKKIIEALSDDKFIEMAKKLIIQAEMFIVGTKRGQDRLAWVVDCLWAYIPKEIAPFVSKEQLIAVVNTIFAQIAIRLDDGTRVAKG